MGETLSWEETIKLIRTQPEYQTLVDNSYFNADLPLNVERFKQSAEFIETLKLLKQYQPLGKTILDIGSGNGVSAIALALDGYNVTTIEPDPSETIGAGAIRKLKEYYTIKDLEVTESFAEELKFKDASFDIVYSRQCMHHAHNLNKFVKEASRVLKKGGIFITIRDHVVFNQKDKEWFLECHPLQKFYGGENAFTADEYKITLKEAGLELKKELKYYDSVVNYFPQTAKDLEKKVETETNNRINSLKKHIGIFASLSLVQQLYNGYVNYRYGPVLNEMKIPGRMYSYISIKK